MVDLFGRLMAEKDRSLNERLFHFPQKIVHLQIAVMFVMFLFSQKQNLNIQCFPLKELRPKIRSSTKKIHIFHDFFIIIIFNHK